MTNRTSGQIPDTLETLSIKVANGVGFIQLDRPQVKNALSTKLFQELALVLEGWRFDDDVAAIVMHGTDEYFSAGLDLEILDRPSDEARLEWYDATHDGYLAILQSAKPTIAAVAGHTLGGGCDIAVFCDMRVASRNSTFGFPQVRFGLTPYVYPLWQLVGPSQAKLLTLTGRRIDVDEALRIGMVDMVVEPNELLDTATSLAEEIASTGVDTVVRATEMMRQSPDMAGIAAFEYGNAQYRDSHWNPSVNQRITDYYERLKSRG